MRKTCKCGKVLSDVLVPNDVVYSVYFDEEWKNQLKEILGGPIYKFLRTVWHCSECDRIYFWNSEDYKLYTYCIDNNKSYKEECSCDGESSQAKLLNLYCYNDFESAKIERQIKNGEEPTFPRKVNFCPKCKIIYIYEEGYLKILKVEEVIDLVK